MIIDQIIKWLIPFFLTAVVVYLKSVVKTVTAIKDSQVALLRNQIINKGEECEEKGYCPSHVRQCMNEMLKNYETLGGNHGLSSWVNRIFLLPSIKKRKTKNSNS